MQNERKIRKGCDWMIDIAHAKQEFEKYLDEYDREDEQICLKIVHTYGVVKYAGEIARKMECSGEDVELAELIGLLHDIGKLRASTYLYGGDDDTLNVEKMRYVRLHAGLGYEVVKAEGYSDRICEMILHHHENYDGTGYPDNLVGDEIPISAQIVSLADVYDALISERAYKKGFTHERAIEMILGGECGIFNPILIDCFMEIEPKIKQKMLEIQ